MAVDQESLQKPWMYLSIGGMLITIFWLALVGLLMLALPSGPLLWILIGVIALLNLLCLLVWGEITALLTAKIFAGLIQNDEEQVHADPPGFVFKTNWMDILVYVLSLPGLSLFLWVQAVFSGMSRPDHDWVSAHPLIPPMIALQDFEIREAVSRVKEIHMKNLLRFQPGYLPVGWVTRIVQWALIVLGAAGGVLIAAWIADPLSSNSLRAFLAAGSGLLVAGILSMVGIAFSTFFRTCYHTALYVWALDVKATQEGADEIMASPPEILSQALSKKPKRKKEGSDATEA
ncbi:MAG: hypothetical protein ACOCYU_01000 [Brevefilum sp.]